MNFRMHTQRIDKQGYTAFTLTTSLTAPLEDARELAPIFAANAEALAKDGVLILEEKIFGCCELRDAALAARAAAYEECGLEAGVPALYLEGAPCHGGLLAGVQIVGAIPGDAGTRVETLVDGQDPVGRLLTAPQSQLAFFSPLSGLSASGDDDVASQARRMFESAGERLRRFGFSWREVARTWIYLPRLLDWYGELNRVRNAWFRECGLIGDDGVRWLPASTGIQAKRFPGEECFMGVLAARAPLAPMSNTRQNEAFEYGSAFARGMAIEGDGRPILCISGTASIDTRGCTRYHGDSRGQVLQTILSVGALLRSRGATFADLGQAVAYCKTPREREVLDEVLWGLGIPSEPILPVLADVCRDELLFEMEAIAVPSAPLPPVPGTALGSTRARETP